jgi:hypothetical protein
MFIATAVLAMAGAASAQVCLYADFDDDGDPWTLRTGTTGESEIIRLILEVPPDPPVGEIFYISVEEGCCEDFQMMGYYGVSSDYFSVALDPAFVDTSTVEIPTCLYCCPWLIWGRFSDSAQMTPGERYFIGQFEAHSLCEPIPPPQCYPPHHIDIGFFLEMGTQCAESSMRLEFWCPGNAVSEGTWSTIKGLYR